ncbi:PWWP domain-containing protein 5-like isoform X1 [Typha latifolia]|uniref:PWWP domain-containing protein 5-like isoform X1 n=1 Tax=Typha latifolia TaxID=4733 RepID=UPI003C2FB499
MSSDRSEKEEAVPSRGLDLNSFADAGAAGEKSDEPFSAAAAETLAEDPVGGASRTPAFDRNGGIKDGGGDDVTKKIEKDTNLVDGSNVTKEEDEEGDKRVVIGKHEPSKRRGRPKKDDSAAENVQHPTNSTPFQDEKRDAFAVSDLVWGKVRSHPWWPGQIFDPSDASDLALKHQKKEHLLVAYFGDKTFAWNDESMLKPFQSHFSQMEKQSSTDAFLTAVNVSLKEVSRRVELALSDRRFVDEDLKYQKVENSGIRGETYSPVVNNSFIVRSFQPERFLDYIRDLGQVPMEGADRLELVIAKAHLRAFNRSRGYPDLPEFLIGGGLEDEAVISPAKKNGSEKGLADSSAGVALDFASGKGKSRGREIPVSKKKHISEDGRKKKRLSELMEEEDVPLSVFGRKSGSGVRNLSGLSGQKHKNVDSASIASRKSKKKKLDSLGDVKPESESPAHKRFSKVGECMRRAAGQLSQSPSILKSNGKTYQGSPLDLKKDDVDDPHTHVETPNVKGSTLKEYSSPSEMLSQLCLAARDPMKGYSFLTMIVDFFTDFKASFASKDTALSNVVGGKSGRKKSANTKSVSLEGSSPDHMQDSYWSDVSSESPEKEQVSSGSKRNQGFKIQREKVEEKGSPEESSVPRLDTAEQLQGDSASANGGKELKVETLCNLEEELEECMPTALILNFNESDALPSEGDLIKIFSRYGPLKEEETEVLKKASRAKVVFKRRVDAEVAFSSAGKFSIFGPALISYRLSYLPSTPRASSLCPSQGKKDSLLVEGDRSEILCTSQDNAKPVHDEPLGNGSSD